jgi:hypothetical protein
MQNPTIRVAAGLAVAVLGLAGCGAGTPSTGSVSPSGAGTAAFAPNSASAGTTTSSSSPAAAGIDDAVNGWKGSSTKTLTGGCAWLTHDQIAGALGGLAPNPSIGTYFGADLGANDMLNPGGSVRLCEFTLGADKASRLEIRRTTYKDVATASKSVRSIGGAQAVPGLGDEASRHFGIAMPSEIWIHILSVRTGNAVVSIDLMVATDPHEEAQLPNRTPEMTALYRLLPRA